jgi:hypothetical protein
VLRAGGFDLKDYGRVTVDQVIALATSVRLTNNIRLHNILFFH